ncbi:MAG: 5-(carboxyamino)imidazole ribonucleotide mutase [Nitrososphaerales archaeon]
MKVAVIAGGKSDQQFVDSAVEILKEFGVDHDAKIISSHRKPNELVKYVKESDADVFIAIAGLAAHLPGSIAAQTIKPVIGVPVAVKLMGLDALLSIVQMPSGIPVATVGVDNAKNAAMLAVEILSIKDDNLKEKLKEYRKKF